MCFQLGRHMTSNALSLNWDRLDDDLFNRHLRGAPLLVLCYLCRNFGHMSSSCPQKVSTSSPSLPPFNNLTQRNENVPPFRAPQRDTQQISSSNTCHFYNRSQCDNDKCMFAHKCKTCFRNHPQFQCPRSKRQ